MRRLALLTLTLAMAPGCVSLSPRAKQIVVTNKSQTKQCRFLKVVYGNGGSKRKYALNEAAHVGASHVVVLYDKGSKITMDAFDCGQAPGPAVAAKPAAPAPTPAPTPATAEPPPALTRTPAQAAQQDWVVAVMDVRTVTKGKGVLDDNLMRNIGDQLRIFLAELGVRTVDRRAQQREELSLVKADSYKGCYDDSCQIELGKALAASHIVRTRITQFGRLCVLNGELVDLRAEVATAAASSRGTCEEEGFLQMSEDVAKALVQGK